MIQRRARSAGLATRIGNHTFRATGITAYLKNGGKLEVAQSMAGHESPRYHRSLRHGVHLPVHAFQRSQHQQPSLQVRCVADGRRLMVLGWQEPDAANYPLTAADSSARLPA